MIARALSATLLAVTLLAAPAMAEEVNFACTDGFKLTLGNAAVVTNKAGRSVALPDSVFTGEANVYTPSGTARSCDRQEACVSGICNDTWCYYDVNMGEEWGRCIARNTFSEE